MHLPQQTTIGIQIMITGVYINLPKEWQTQTHRSTHTIIIQEAAGQS